MKIGIDLGTANVLVFVQGQGITVREPSVVAIDAEDRIVAVGNDAKEMLGRTPGNITAITPDERKLLTEWYESAVSGAGKAEGKTE